MAEVLELAGNCARDLKMKTIKPRHVMMAVEMDDELKPIFDEGDHAGSRSSTRHPSLLRT